MVISNAERATWAGKALSAWREAKGEHTSDESDERDLIADLLHLLASDGRDAIEELDRAQRNFEAERRGDHL